MELRYALRRLRRTPGFTVAALLTLALGIGANALIFSVVNAIFLRPLPYRDPGRLFWATEFFPTFFKMSIVPAPEYAAWKRRSTAFERLEALSATMGVNVSSAGRAAERAEVGHVTPGFFPMLGVAPRIGTGFAANADDSVAMISDAFWRSYFQGDESILGKSVTVNGKPVTILGVMPPGFVYPDAADAALWLPDAAPPAAVRQIHRGCAQRNPQDPTPTHESTPRRLRTEFPHQ